MSDRQPKPGEGQVTINTKLRSVPIAHPSWPDRMRRAGLEHVVDEIERLTKGWEGLEYEASAQIASLAAAVNTMHKEAIEQEKHIAKLEAERETWDGHKVCKLLRSDLADAVDQIEQLTAENTEYLRNGSKMLSEIEQLRAGCDRLHGYIAEKDAKLQAVVDAAKGVTEYGEVAFMGVNIPFKSFRKLKEALAALKDKL